MGVANMPETSHFATDAAEQVNQVDRVARQDDRPKLRLLRLGEEVDRPLASVYAVLQKWREPFRNPQWRVEVAWVTGLRRRTGRKSRLVLFDAHKVARIDVDAALHPHRIKSGVLGALAELQLLELSALTGPGRMRLSEEGGGERPLPPGA